MLGKTPVDSSGEPGLAQPLPPPMGPTFEPCWDYSRCFQTSVLLIMLLPLYWKSLPKYFTVWCILFYSFKNIILGTSLVVQWLRICLPMQGTWVRALVQEEPTCHGATKPVCHNYWACALGPMSHNYWARVPQLLKPARLEPELRNKRNHCNEKPAHRNEDPTRPKINKLNK